MCTGLPQTLQKGLQGEGAGWVSCVTSWMFQSGQELFVGKLEQRMSLPYRQAAPEAMTTLSALA